MHVNLQTVKPESLEGNFKTCLQAAYPGVHISAGWAVTQEDMPLRCQVIALRHFS